MEMCNEGRVCGSESWRVRVSMCVVCVWLCMCVRECAWTIPFRTT